MDIPEVPIIIKDTGLVVEYTKEGTGFVGAFIEVVNLEVPFIIKDTGLAVEYTKEGTDLERSFIIENIGFMGASTGVNIILEVA